MGKIQELYDTRVRPMGPAERLQLAKLILDDLAPRDGAEVVSNVWGDEATKVASVLSPRLARPDQAGDFAKEILELPADAKL